MGSRGSVFWPDHLQRACARGGDETTLRDFRGVFNRGHIQDESEHPGTTSWYCQCRRCACDDSSEQQAGTGEGPFCKCAAGRIA